MGLSSWARPSPLLGVPNVTDHPLKTCVILNCDTRLVSQLCANFILLHMTGRVKVFECSQKFRLSWECGTEMRTNSTFVSKILTQFFKDVSPVLMTLFKQLPRLACKKHCPKWTVMITYDVIIIIYLLIVWTTSTISFYWRFVLRAMSSLNRLHCHTL